MALRVPIRQAGSGVPLVGKLDIPIAGNPKEAANAGDLIRLLIGKDIFSVGGGGLEVVGTPTQGQVPKWNAADMQWQPGDDLTAMPGASVQSDWASTDPLNAAFILNKPTLFSGAYTDLTGLPTLFSGDYDDLINKPSIPVLPNIDEVLTGQPVVSGQLLTFMQHDGGTVSVTLPSGGGGGGTQVNADWDATSGLAEILNKPDLRRPAVGHFRHHREHAHLRSNSAAARPRSICPTITTTITSTASWRRSTAKTLTMTLGRTGSLGRPGPDCYLARGRRVWELRTKAWAACSSARST